MNCRLGHALIAAACALGTVYVIFVTGLLVANLISPAHGRDLGQWHNINPPEVSQWYRSLMRPDPGYTRGSCCGDADAYWCDDITVKDGHVFCAITDTRDDTVLQRQHRPIGELHEIPPEKMKWSKTDPQPNLGNPTGHAVIFLGSQPGQEAFVYCFVPGAGS